MTIKIGGKSFATRKPSDLDAQLGETTGCNAAEVARMITGNARADLIARAMAPFLTDGPTWQEVMMMLNADILGEAIADTAKLYAKVEPAPDPIENAA